MLPFKKNQAMQEIINQASDITRLIALLVIYSLL